MTFPTRHEQMGGHSVNELWSSHYKGGTFLGTGDRGGKTVPRLKQFSWSLYSCGKTGNEKNKYALCPEGLNAIDNKDSR